MEKDLKEKSRYEIPKLEVMSDVTAEGAAICAGGSGAAACDPSGAGATACASGSSATSG